MASPFIIVPLYIYPLEAAWKPLVDVALAHPKVHFLAVINPNNGPGQSPLPDASYLAALQEINGIPNIQPLGYVYCTYGKRSLADIKKDIDLYRGWNASFRLDGIFIDEAPSVLEHVKYMTEIRQYAEETWQSALAKSSLIIHNPGVAVSQDFFDVADYVVAFEQSESHWRSHFKTYDLHQLPQEARSKTVIIMHTCNTSHDALEQLVKDITSHGFAGVYVTEQEGGGYTQWPDSWHQLAKVVELQS